VRVDKITEDQVESTGSKPNKRLLVVAYGSLLSGYGILAERRGGGSRLIARHAFPLILSNARRGLAKPSSHGTYLAMDLEPIVAGQPLVAHRADQPPASGGIGVLGLELDREWAPLIARREEYEPAKFVELIEQADAAGLPIGVFLLQIAERTGFDLLTYRTALRELLGYTSHGYIFHPIPFADGRVGIAAIGSGYEGSGDPAIQSKRREFGLDRLLSLAEALAITAFELDREGQIGYFVECLLGGLHGLAVTDLVAGLMEDDALSMEVARHLAAIAPHERGYFAAATSLEAERYRKLFAQSMDERVRRFFPS
jgi:hypothetical protein